MRLPNFHARSRDMRVPKPSRVRDAQYIRWLREMPCCVCAHMGETQTSKTEAHHVVKTRGAGGGDDGAAPFCTRHHKMWHLIGRKTFRERVGFDPVTVAQQLWSDFQQQGWTA